MPLPGETVDFKLSNTRNLGEYVASQKILRPIECNVQVVGSGPNYYIVEAVWHFIPTSKKTSNLQLFNLGDNFNSINTIELHFLNTTAKLKKNEDVAIVFDEFIYGGRLN